MNKKKKVFIFGNILGGVKRKVRSDCTFYVIVQVSVTNLLTCEKKKRGEHEDQRRHPYLYSVLLAPRKSPNSVENRHAMFTCSKARLNGKHPRKTELIS